MLSSLFNNIQLAIAIVTYDEELQKSTYFEMADAYYKTKEYLQAINCYEEMLKLAPTEDEKQNVKVYQNLGAAYQELKNLDQAINYYEDALKITVNQTSNTIKLYLNLGHCFFSQEKIEKASDCYVKGLELAIKLNDANLQGEAYNRLHAWYKHTGDHDKAIEYYEKALAVAVAADDKQSQATAFENLGNVYRTKGDYTEAIKYHERQLQICINIESNIESKNGQVRAYGCLGMDYDKLGNFNEEIKISKNILKICEDIDNKNDKKKIEAISHYNLGNAYQAIGQYPECLAHNKQSLKLTKEIGNQDLEGLVHYNLGGYFMALGKFGKADEHYKEALEIALKVGDEKREASVYGKLGICKITSNKYDEASVLFDKQIRIAERIKDKVQEGRGYRCKGIVYHRFGDYEQARYYYEHALTIAKAIAKKDRLSKAFQTLGSLYMHMAGHNNIVKGEQVKTEHCIAKSIHFFKESLTLDECLFDQLQNKDHFKVSLLENITFTYHILTYMLLASRDHKEALLVSERGRARALNDLLISKYTINGDKQSGSDRITCNEIQNMASDFSILLYSRFPPAGQCTWVICKGNVSSLVEECDFSNILESVYGTLKVRQVQCEDRSINTDDHQSQHKVSVSQLKFNVIDDVSDELLLSACKMIKTRCIPDEDLYDDDDDNLNLLEGLYKCLISPVQDQLTKDDIVIIPDGDLFKVPFAALRDPKTEKFLFETKRIRIAPSLTSLKALQESPVDFHSKTGAVIIGNPKVGKVMFRGETKVITDLPCAEREAEMIGKLLGVKPFIGSQATKEIIKQNLREGVAIIHFAAHGTTDGEIFLAPSTTDGLPSEEDYILTMKDVQESGVRPQLVVLSCCHSGRGEIKAEGVVGMSRAFLAAGARAVVASLWAIADQATMVFMKKFYTHLKEGKSASKSLQAAMKDMREIPRYSDPQFWAPFFLIGDDVTITMWNK